MFGLFTDNKPEIIKAIGAASVHGIAYFDELKNLVLKTAHENEDAVFIPPVGDMIFVNYKMLVLPKKNSISVQGSSREMFQALNQISKNAKYNAESDYASGDVGGFEINMMRMHGLIHITAEVKNRNAMLIELIKDNGRKTL